VKVAARPIGAATRARRLAARTLASALAFVFALAALPPRAAHSNAEQFSTFSAERQEEDDESALDHLLAREPRAWREEWERAPQALRTSQGCLTSGQWIDFTQLKLETALGNRARFGVEYVQHFDNIQSYDDLALSFRFPIHTGRLSGDFHPTYDKSRQDFAFGWDSGPDTSSFHLAISFMIEDMLNNLWAWRQTRVGDQSEPYLKHPYLPQLSLISRHERWRFDLGGRYLTPSEKQVNQYLSNSTPTLQTLWGTYAWGGIETRAFGWGLEARTENLQALGTGQPLDYSAGNHLDFRRQWSAEGTLSRAFAPRWNVFARYLYQARTELYGESLGPGRFDALDRIVQLEAERGFAPGWAVRAGALYDRVAFAREGVTLAQSETRPKESRAYVTLAARFGKVNLEGTEGFELDIEPYDVMYHHDKGFLKLQTTF
jgi:hypothetical protein